MCWSLFLMKLQAFKPATSLKWDSNAGVFCEYYKIFKNNYFKEHLRTTASQLRRIRDPVKHRWWNFLQKQSMTFEHFRKTIHHRLPGSYISLFTKKMLNLFTLHKKWSFPLRIPSIKMAKPAFPADLVTYTEEILNGKLHFLRSLMIIMLSSNKNCFTFRRSLPVAF